MPFREVSSKVEFASLEEGINQFWERERIFEKSLEERTGASEFVFYDGPPFATGLPHYGHLLAGTLKDIVPRYRTMRGYHVERRFGWDCHGLPVEYEMEKQLQLQSRRDIERYGIVRFNEACRGIVLRYTAEWRKTVRRMGRWVDFENDYKTMDLEYMESIWWVFRRIWDQGLVYEGFKVMPYCPRCATPLSNFETAQGYQEVQDPAITVRFRATPETERALGAGHPLWFLAWTTTPWTLPSNLALAVGADIPYVRVLDEGEEYVVARGRASAYWKHLQIGASLGASAGTAAVEAHAAGTPAGGAAGSDEARVLESFPGSRLAGLHYEPLLPYFAAEAERGAFRLLAADFVTTEEGTGIVHAAPAFGEDDYALAQAQGLPLVCPVDAEGRFTEPVREYAGRFVKDADADIIKALRQAHRLVRRDTLVHSYPHCYRCESPLIYRAITTWFVRIDAIKAKMLQANERIHWAPAHLKEGRFGQWLQNARDWAISRNRYWGTPLPVWRCDSCGAALCIGSIAELQERGGRRVTDLHKHFVDDIAILCECGGTRRRIPEVLDCWFESGSMPYAQSHYPFENKAKFEANFPAEFIAEGIDQTRGWFYTLIVLSAALFDAPAFKNVIVNGLVLAEDGKKMSKRLHNYPEPDAVIDRYGADALRLYLMNSAVVRGENLRFSETGVQEALRSILLPLWNAYSFFVTYANADGWEPGVEPGAPAARRSGAAAGGRDDALAVLLPSARSRTHLLDRWILSAEQRLVRTVTESMEAYELQRAIEPIVRFVDDLTNWYVRRSRRRFWKSENDTDKRQAYETLYAVLLETCRILAPYTPFIAEAIYRNLIEPARARGVQAPASVHLCAWPEYRREEEDEELDERMDVVIRTASMGRALRTAHGLKVRQPLRAIHVATRDRRAREALEEMSDLLRDELNVKEVRFDARESELVEWSVKANFKTLGPRLGREVQRAARAIAELPLETVLEIEAGTPHELRLEGLDVTLGPQDVIVERREKAGLFVQCSGSLTVALDHELTPELVEEGLVREFVNRVQNLRKEAGLQVVDRIRVQFHSPAPEVERALRNHADSVRSETLALELEQLPAPPEGATLTDLNGHACEIRVEKLEAGP